MGVRSVASSAIVSISLGTSSQELEKMKGFMRNRRIILRDINGALFGNAELERHSLALKTKNGGRSYSFMFGSGELRDCVAADVEDLLRKRQTPVASRI